jgi:4-hydroxybenzoyl-CoA reductase subunit beta
MTMYVPSFRLHRPKSLKEALALTQELQDFDFLGGGTDLLCNYKNKLNPKEEVISLTHIAELKELSPTRIGGGVNLSALASDAAIAATHPVIPQTVRKIASPLIRQTATVGGNLLVDTRCYWFNQTPEFRRALGSCLKAESEECRVVPNPSICYAAYSGDLGPVLWALDARVHLVGPKGERRVSLQEFFLPSGSAHTMDDGAHLDGIGRNTKRPDEIIVAVEIPPESQELSAGYMKLRARDALDFPDAGVAIALRRDAKGRLEMLRMVVGAVAPTPLDYSEAGSALLGTLPDEDALTAFGERLSAAVTPHKNTWFSSKYRRKIVGIYGKRILRDLLG